MAERRNATETYVQNQLGVYVPKSLYDANSVLAATADDTPAAVTMGASTMLARLATGDIKAASVAEIQTLVQSKPEDNRSFSFGGTDHWSLPGIIPISQTVYNTGGADRALWQYHWFSRDSTVTAFGIEVTTFAASSTLTCYIYAMNEATFQPTGSQIGASAAMASATNGFKTSTGHSIVVPRGLYGVQIVNGVGNPTYRVILGNNPNLVFYRDGFTATPVVYEFRTIPGTPGGAITNITTGGGNFGQQYGCFLRIT